MNTVKFLPKVVTGEEHPDGTAQTPTFSGHIMLKVPDFFERQALKSLVIGIIARNGEADLESLQDAASSKSKINVADALGRMAELVRASVPFYQEIALVRLSDGQAFKSFDDLSCDASCEEILQEVAKELAGGLKLGKKQ